MLVALDSRVSSESHDVGKSGQLGVTVHLPVF